MAEARPPSPIPMLRHRLDERAAELERTWPERSALHGWSGDATCRSCGDSGTVPESGSPCGLCDRGDDRRWEREIERQRGEVVVAKWAAIAPPRYRDASLASRCPHTDATAARTWTKAVATLTEWAQRDPWALTNLALTGSTGLGKTYLAYAALRALLDRGTTDMVARSATKLLVELQPGGPDGWLQRLCTVPVLLIDDIGAGRVTDWGESQLEVILDERGNAELPTIVTANKALLSLTDTIGERSVSRLQDGLVAVGLIGRDLRANGGAS